MPERMTNGQYSRRVLRINRFTILMDVVTTGIAVGLVIFYIFSLVSAPFDTQSQMDFKLLLAYVCFTVILRIFYMIQLIAKLKVYMEQGPCEVVELPFQNLIDFVGKFVPLVEPGHIICLCWMTSRVFPFKSCGETYWAVCRSMQIASTVFVAIWIFTGLFVVFVIFSIAFYGGNQARRSEVLTLTPIPDPLRHSIINNLPISYNAPPDNEPCAICFEVDTQHEWRVLPCGHRFHPNCIDEWLRKPNGTCPTCRQDPAARHATNGMPQEETRLDVQEQEQEQEQEPEPEPEQVVVRVDVPQGEDGQRDRTQAAIS